MTTPLTNSTSSNGTNALARAGLSKPVLGVFTLGALGFSAWRMKDAFVGSQQKANQQVSTLKADNDYQLTEYNFGQYSGSPGMDKLALKYDGLKRYGPFRLKENYQSAKIHVNNFFSNVIGPNLLPLGVGLAGLYGTIGHEKMMGYGKNIITWWNGCSILNSQAWTTLKEVGKSIGSGLWQATKAPVEMTFKSPQHFAIASGITLVGAFFAKRFVDNVNGDAQKDFYRDDLFP
ncbi:hypothetical protein [Vampirovibrio sp.]|uniref:hypothetical protein n=1 Tax=Vampirovibrio sp. TaxID=2717857 RepID=UPI0035943CA7